MLKYFSEDEYFEFDNVINCYNPNSRQIYEITNFLNGANTNFILVMMKIIMKNTH